MEENLFFSPFYIFFYRCFQSYFVLNFESLPQSHFNERQLTPRSPFEYLVHYINTNTILFCIFIAKKKQQKNQKPKTKKNLKNKQQQTNKLD